MPYLSLLFYLIVFDVGAETYKGPQVAGVEKYGCGEYEVKGRFNKIEDKLRKSTIFFLTPYAETLREYKIRLHGDLEKIQDGSYIKITGKSYRDWSNSRPELYVTKLPKVTNHYEALENTVNLVQSISCK